MNKSSIWAHIRGLAKAIGWVKTVSVLSRRLLKRPGTIEVSLRRLDSRPRVKMRPCDSDLFVASQTAGWLDYEMNEPVSTALRSLMDDWHKSGSTPLIIDGGANVGYSSLFFADRFPSAVIIACEPDRPTFEVLVDNVAHEPRIRPQHIALWNNSEGIQLTGGGNGSWSKTVASGHTEGSHVPSTTLPELERSVVGGRTAILKLDIEGAERKACEAGRSILSNAPCIIVEPHDFLNPGGATLLSLIDGLQGREVDTLLSGENLFFIDSSLVGSAKP